MQISAEHLSRLARLALTPEESERFGSQLGKILEYVEALNGLDTGSVEPTSHVLSLQNVAREDTVVPSLPREDALANAPDGTSEFYRVPKIIE